MARFSSSRGEWIPLARLPNAGRSLWQVVRRRCFGQYPEVPWIPFAAIRCLERELGEDAVAWEIGAGMSTLWLARHAARVVSIEASSTWHSKLHEILRERGIANVDLRYEWKADRMSSFDDVADESLDLLFVDGGPRHACLVNGLPKVKPGGLVYLDNTDVAEFWPATDDFLRGKSAEFESQQVFVDYVPGNFCVNEGILLRKAQHRG